MRVCAPAALGRCAELEAELARLRATSGVAALFTLPTKEDVLQGARGLRVSGP